MKTWSYGINRLLSEVRSQISEVGERKRTEVGGRPGEIRFAVTSSISLGKEGRGRTSEVRDRRSDPQITQIDAD